MKRQKDLLALYDKIMTEVYLKSTPQGDWGELRGNDVKDWFNAYYIDNEELKDIFNRNIRWKRLRPYELSQLSRAVYLGAVPTSNYERFLEERAEIEKQQNETAD